MFTPINDTDLKATNGGVRQKIHPSTGLRRRINPGPMRIRPTNTGPQRFSIDSNGARPPRPQGMSALKKAGIAGVGLVAANGTPAGGLAISDLAGGTHFYGDSINDSSDE